MLCSGHRREVWVLAPVPRGEHQRVGRRGAADGSGNARRHNLMRRLVARVVVHGVVDLAPRVADLWIGGPGRCHLPRDAGGLFLHQLREHANVEANGQVHGAVGQALRPNKNVSVVNKHVALVQGTWLSLTLLLLVLVLLVVLLLVLVVLLVVVLGSACSH